MLPILVMDGVNHRPLLWTRVLDAASTRYKTKKNRAWARFFMRVVFYTLTSYRLIAIHGHCCNYLIILGLYGLSIVHNKFSFFDFFRVPSP